MTIGVVRVPQPPGGWGEPWPRVFELANHLPQSSWMLIGGLMVQAHGLAAGITVTRPTLDVDLIVLVHTDPDPLGETVRKIEGLGYRFKEPMSRTGPAHRCLHNCVLRPSRGEGAHVLQIPRRVAPSVG